MDNLPIGAIAAASSLNGSRLKVVVVGQGGALRDANCRLGPTSPQTAIFPNLVPMLSVTSTEDMRWTEGSAIGTVHPQSSLAVCTIERLNLACFFYQLPDSSIVMRRCHMGSEWKWEDDYTTILTTRTDAPPAAGTSISIQPSILRVGDNSDFTFFYQTISGTLGVQKITEAGKLHGRLFLTQISIPQSTPFTALTLGDEFTISYATLHTNEVWECSGSLALMRGEFEEETYVSVAQNLVLSNPPTPLIAQIASYHAEHPIVYIQTSGRPTKLVWSSARARRTYHFASRGMPSSPIALVGHLPLQSHVTMLFVDISGAVNVARLPAMSADGNQPPKCTPIPLDSMKDAFSWAIKEGVPAPVGGSLGLDLRPRITSPLRPPQHPLSGHLGSWSNRVESRVSQSGVHSTAEIVQTGFKSTHDIAQTGFHSIQNMLQPTTDIIQTGLPIKPIREVVQTRLEPVRASWKWGRGLWSRSASDEARSESTRASGGDVGEDESEGTGGSDNEIRCAQQKSFHQAKTEHRATTVYHTKTEHTSTTEHNTSTKYWTEAGYGPKPGPARRIEYDQRTVGRGEPSLHEVVSPTLPRDVLKPRYVVEEVDHSSTQEPTYAPSVPEVIRPGPQMPVPHPYREPTPDFGYYYRSGDHHGPEDWIEPPRPVFGTPERDDSQSQTKSETGAECDFETTNPGCSTPNCEHPDSGTTQEGFEDARSCGHSVLQGGEIQYGEGGNGEPCQNDPVTNAVSDIGDGAPGAQPKDEHSEASSTESKIRPANRSRSSSSSSSSSSPSSSSSSSSSSPSDAESEPVLQPEPEPVSVPEPVPQSRPSSRLSSVNEDSEPESDSEAPLVTEPEPDSPVIEKGPAPGPNRSCNSSIPNHPPQSITGSSSTDVQAHSTDVIAISHEPCKSYGTSEVYSHTGTAATRTPIPSSTAHHSSTHTNSHSQYESKSSETTVTTIRTLSTRKFTQTGPRTTTTVHSGLPSTGVSTSTGLEPMSPIVPTRSALMHPAQRPPGERRPTSTIGDVHAGDNPARVKGKSAPRCSGNHQFPGSWDGTDEETDTECATKFGDQVVTKSQSETKLISNAGEDTEPQIETKCPAKPECCPPECPPKPECDQRVDCPPKPNCDANKPPFIKPNPRCPIPGCEYPDWCHQDGELLPRGQKPVESQTPCPPNPKCGSSPCETKPNHDPQTGGECASRKTNPRCPIPGCQYPDWCHQDGELLPKGQTSIESRPRVGCDPKLESSPKIERDPPHYGTKSDCNVERGGEREIPKTTPRCPIPGCEYPDWCHQFDEDNTQTTRETTSTTSESRTTWETQETKTESKWKGTDVCGSSSNGHKDARPDYNPTSKCPPVVPLEPKSRTEHEKSPDCQTKPSLPESIPTVSNSSCPTPDLKPDPITETTGSCPPAEPCGGSTNPKSQLDPSSKGASGSVVAGPSGQGSSDGDSASGRGGTDRVDDNHNSDSGAQKHHEGDDQDHKVREGGANPDDQSVNVHSHNTPTSGDSKAPTSQGTSTLGTGARTPLQLPQSHHSPLTSSAKPPQSELNVGEQSFLDTLYNHLRYVIKPFGNRYLSLQVPSRDLDNGKPNHPGLSQARTEIESQLADDLFDAAKFVSGPNGKSLSKVYARILDNLIPNAKSDVASSLRSQREKIVNYLLEDVHGGPYHLTPSTPPINRPTGVKESPEDIHRNIEFAAPPHQTSPYRPSEPMTPSVLDTRDSVSDAELAIASYRAPPYMPLQNSQRGFQNPAPVGSHGATRLGYSQQLASTYGQRTQWEQQKNVVLRTANEAYCAFHSPTYNANLRGDQTVASYTEALARGHAHSTNELLGYLDVKTAAEILYRAKSRFQASSQTWAYASRSTRPVVMWPVDWREASQSSYLPEDVNYDIDLLKAQILQKSRRLDNLTTQLSTFIVPNDQDLMKAEAEVNVLAKERDEIQRKINSEFSASTVAALKLQTMSLGEPAFTLNASSEPKLPGSQSKNLESNSTIEYFRTLQATTQKLFAATRVLATMRTNTTSARFDCSILQQRARAEKQVTELQYELEQIESRLNFAQLAATRRIQDLKLCISDVRLPHTDDSRWTAINFSTVVSNSLWQESPKTPADIGLWLSSSLIHSPQTSAQRLAVEVGFRTMVVEIDRSGWMDTEFMERSDQLLRVADGLRWSTWPNGAVRPKDMAELIMQGNFEDNESAMPAFPTGLIIAKDILVKIPISGQIAKETLLKQARGAMGILCFRFSPEVLLSGTRGATHIHEFSDGIVVRIPGPQILGYNMEISPMDATNLYNPSSTASDIEYLLTERNGQRSNGLGVAVSKNYVG